MAFINTVGAESGDLNEFESDFHWPSKGIQNKKEVTLTWVCNYCLGTETSVSVATEPKFPVPAGWHENQVESPIPQWRVTLPFCSMLCEALYEMELPTEPILMA